MNQKTNSLIKALETIDAASLHGLADALVYEGAIIPELRHHRLTPIGWNPKKNHTIAGTPDSVVEHEGDIYAFEYSRTGDTWKTKLKEDVESVRKWIEDEEKSLAHFIFISTQDIENRKMPDGSSPAEFAKKKLGVESTVVGQKSLLVTLQDEHYCHIRRQWLSIPDDFFQSLGRFKEHCTEHAKRRLIYLDELVTGPLQDDVTQAIREFISGSDAQVLLVHAPGGMGKTRLVIDALEQRSQDSDFDEVITLCARRKANIDVDSAVSEIPDNRDSLVIIDDAHLVDNLSDFRALSSKRPRAKLILISRSTAKEQVKRAIGSAEELKMPPLDEEAAITLLEQNLQQGIRKEALKSLARICMGVPLLIGIAAHLVNTRKIGSAQDIKKNDLVREYLQEIIEELKQRNPISPIRYQPYAALLHLLRPLSIDDRPKRATVREIVSIDEVAEGVMLRDLASCGAVEQSENDLWIYPDLLGEYLIEEVFFSDIPILDFLVQNQVTFFDKCCMAVWLKC